jgi:hypothetical protein
MRKALAVRSVVRQGVLIRAALGLAACLLTALVYIPSLDNPFVLDDRTTVLLNPSLVDVTDWRGILVYDRWHPLVNAAFAIDRALSGFSSFGFHITNGLLHVIVVALLFGWCTRLLDDDWTSFFAAAAFGINPVTARSAAYVSARPDLLFAAGVLLVAILVRRAYQRGSRTSAALAGVAAALTLAAAPWGFAAAHGPQRFYLPAAALCAGAAWLVRAPVSRSRFARVAGVLAVALLVVVTRQALTRWSDPVALWSREVARAPQSWDAHLGYADALREASRCDTASGEYREALQLKPGLEDARRGLARCGEGSR